MGYSYRVFAVDYAELDKLRKGDEALFKKLAAKCKEEMESVEEYLEEGFENAQDEDEEGGGGGFFGVVGSIFGKKKKEEPKKPDPAIGDKPISGEQALRHLVVGGDFVPYGGTAYGYLFEAVCTQIGKDLDTEGWESLRSSVDWDGEITKALNKSGIKFPLSEVLLARGGPIDYPQGDDFPYVGHFTPEESQELSSLMANLDIVAAAKHTFSPPDAEVSLKNLKGWVDRCAASKEWVVTFYY